MAQIVSTTNLGEHAPRVVHHEDGVYLGLSHEQYIRDAAIGSGSLKELLHAPAEWWWSSPYNTIAPNDPDEGEKNHFRLGTAVHVALLEGWDTFDLAYGCLPTKFSHPNALDTIDDLTLALRGLGQSPTGTKEVLVERLRAADPSAEILLLMQREFLLSGKRAISDKEFAIIRLLHGMATGSGLMLDLPQYEGMSLRDAFVGGLSEVSVFWTDDDGIRQRARFDKLLPFVTIDLKTITKWAHANFRARLLYEIAMRGYFLQVAQYEAGRHQLRRLVAEGKVFGGTPEQRDLLEEIAQVDAWSWMWVFAKTKGYPAIKGIRFNPDQPAYQRALTDREDALANFLQYREMFGLEPGRIWIDPQPIWTPEEQDWPFLAGSDI